MIEFLKQSFFATLALLGIIAAVLPPATAIAKTKSQITQKTLQINGANERGLILAIPKLGQNERVLMHIGGKKIIRQGVLYVWSPAGFIVAQEQNVENTSTHYMEVSNYKMVTEVVIHINNVCCFDRGHNSQVWIKVYDNETGQLVKFVGGAFYTQSGGSEDGTFKLHLESGQSAYWSTSPAPTTADFSYSIGQTILIV